MALTDNDFLCNGWIWDAAMRELKKYRRKRKGWEDEPEAIEQLKTVRSVTWHKWSQTPMQSSTGLLMPPSLSRVVAAYESGGDLTINEYDRGCAEKLAGAIANAYGLQVIEEGAPGGRRGGNLAERDQMGRLVNRSGREEVVLDEVAGDIVISKQKRPFGKSKRTLRTSDLRQIELSYEVRGPTETFTVWGITGAEEKVALASYSGFEGWADPEEWRTFTADLGRSLGVEVRT